MDRLDTVRAAGAADSKQLSDARRREVLASLRALDGFVAATRSVSAREISARMLAPARASLNALAFEAARGLLADFAAAHEVEEAVVDLISPAAQYAAYIKEKLPRLRLRIEAKADARYPIVGAASIVAKVARDDALGPGRGSGYPSDPATQRWLREHLDPVYGFLDREVRFSWETVQRMVREGCRKCVWRSDAEREGRKKTGALARRGPSPGK